MKHPIRVILFAAFCLMLGACKSKQPKPDPQPTTDDVTTTTPDTRGAQTGRYSGPEALETDSCLRQRVVYFDFDRSEIKSEFQEIVSCHATYLQQFSGAGVTREGKADERGTREYNLGLGERRGNAVSSAMSSAGASSSQLNVVSYGEERPTCKEHNEGCWHKNRRVEIVYTSKQ